MEKWIKDIEQFVRDNNDILNNRQFAEFIGCAPSTVAWIRCQIFGLKKMDLEYWTDTQVMWLKKLYTWMGDYEIALIFNEAYPKNKTWTLKHIEKKRNYLGLHRTKEQLNAIRKRNYEFGSWAPNLKRIHKERLAPIGTIRIWKDRPYIRTEKGNEPYLRWLWEQNNGNIPEGMNIVRIDHKKPLNDASNLKMITDAELGASNSIHRYPLELKQAIITLNKLNKLINEKQDSRCS